MAQFAIPNEDISVTDITGDPNDTTGELYQNIDESSESDTDFVWSTDNTDTVFEIKLSSVINPNTGSGHICRYRFTQTNDGVPDGGGSTSTLLVQVVDGTTVIAGLGGLTNTTGSYTTSSFTLTSPEADDITDYSDLRIRFTISGGGGSPANRRGIGISWTRLEVPEVVASTRRIFNVT